MSLADRLTNAQPSLRQQCLTCKWYEKLDTEDQKAFDDFIGRVGETFSVAHFHRLCLGEGLACGLSSFTRHLKDHCGPR